MKRPQPEDRSDPLFDLPLDHGPDGVGSGPEAGLRNDNEPTSEVPTQPPLPLEAPPRTSSAAAGEAPAAGQDESVASPSLLNRRVRGGLLDLGAHALVVALAVAGSWWLGVSPKNLTLLPLVLFCAGFSFVYHVLPLVFWGQTPGMARWGLVARSDEGQPLTIGQAVRRWFGALLCVASLGALLAFGTRRTIADRLSGSIVHVAP